MCYSRFSVPALIAYLITTATAAEITAPHDLKAPSSPAFALVGVSPTKIDRPASARAFGLTVLNATTESSSGIPKNIALEIAPYWWADRSPLTNEEFENAGTLKTIRQSAAISVTTFEKEATETVKKYTGIGIGLNFDIVRGRIDPKYVQRTKMAMLAAVDTGGFGADPTPAQQKELSNLALGYDGSRIGNQLAFATAVSYRFIENDLDEKELDRFGAWLTYAYKPTSPSGFWNQFTALITMRALVEQASPSDKRYTDVGCRIVWRAPSHPFSASFEYLKRYKDARDESLSLLVQYAINASTYVFLSNGKQFESDSEMERNVTVAGLSLSWGNGARLK